ncbi:MAG: hypothetical protein HZB14_06970 [Actinobacteria bacterium]|nr:hypothetical protein [Actinomycetota bacterium]
MKQFGSAVKLSAILCVSLLALFALAGCGDDKDASGGDTKTFQQDETVGEAGKVKVDSEDQFSAEQQEVIDRIGEFADATEAKDYEKICEDFFTEEAQKLGGDCEATLKKTGSTIKDFEITVTAVEMGADGKTATATATTVTNGQAGGSQSITLAKDKKGEWRVTILGN